MRAIIFVIICLSTLFYKSDGSIHQVMAQDRAQSPQVTLAAENEPLGNLLDTLSQDTGYRFNLNKEWRDYPVSTSIVKLPLERGLKRLLRNLNYTITWESDKIITINILSKVDPKIARPDTSPPLSLPTYAAETQPVVEPENLSAEQPEANDVSLEEAQVNGNIEEAANPEAGTDESAPQEGIQEEQLEMDQNETDAPPDDTSDGSS